MVKLVKLPYLSHVDIKRTLSCKYAFINFCRQEIERQMIQCWPRGSHSDLLQGLTCKSQSTKGIMVAIRLHKKVMRK